MKTDKMIKCLGEMMTLFSIIIAFEAERNSSGLININ
jgi:hypothetical protein